MVLTVSCQSWKTCRTQQTVGQVGKFHRSPYTRPGATIQSVFIRQLTVAGPKFLETLWMEDGLTSGKRKTLTEIHTKTTGK